MLLFFGSILLGSIDATGVESPALLGDTYTQLTLAEKRKDLNYTFPGMVDFCK